MDPFDEFEFKPLTEGLGFHKKSEKSAKSADIARPNSRVERDTSNLSAAGSTAASLADTRSLALNSEIENELLGRESTRAPSQSISDLIASLPPSLDFVDSERPLQSEPKSRPQIFQPLAREEYNASPAQNSSAGATIGQVLPTPGSKAISHVSTAAAIPVPTIGGLRPPQASPYRDRLDESFSKAFPHAERTAVKRADLGSVVATESGQLIAIPTHFGAAFLDAMVITGMSAVLLVCTVMITHVNLLGLLNNTQTDGPTQIHLALLFITVLQLYVLTARSFFTATLGEWAFELQLGSPTDQKRSIFPLLVAWRSLLMTATGLVIVPLLSLIFRRDLAKYVTGLQLYRRV